MKKFKFTFFCILLFISQSVFSQSVVKNGQFWNDTQGNRIEAHGAGIVKHGDRWYMVGEDKSQGFTFKAVNLYSSPDLVNWTFENDVINKNSHPQLQDGSRFIERPKLIYNDSTDTFVIWCHWEGPENPGDHNYSTAAAAVFYCDSVNGDYIFHKAFRPLGNMSRDCNLFKDEDGKAYFFSAANHNKDLKLYELTSDYLDVQRLVSTLFPGQSRESPVIFKKKNGMYYLLTSGTTGWEPNQGKYATATSIGGPWNGLYNFGDNTTYDSQPTTLITVQGSHGTTYIYCGDRWKDPTLAESKYIWLPLAFKGKELSVDYYDEWDIK